MKKIFISSIMCLAKIQIEKRRFLDCSDEKIINPEIAVEVSHADKELY